MKLKFIVKTFLGKGKTIDAAIESSMNSFQSYMTDKMTVSQLSTSISSVTDPEIWYYTITVVIHFITD